MLQKKEGKSILTWQLFDCFSGITRSVFCIKVSIIHDSEANNDQANDRNLK